MTDKPLYLMAVKNYPQISNPLRRVPARRFGNGSNGRNSRRMLIIEIIKIWVIRRKGMKQKVM